LFRPATGVFLGLSNFVEGGCHMQSKFIALLAGAALSLGFVNVASAADMAVKARPVAPPPVLLYDWSGFYIGANGGWGSSS
jgi:hypothetical protein